MCACFAGDTAFYPADWRGRPEDWPETRYEKKMLAGHKPVFLRLRRR
jgi:tRNA (guanine-N7-)-methyltransferase